MGFLKRVQFGNKTKVDVKMCSDFWRVICPNGMFGAGFGVKTVVATAGKYTMMIGWTRDAEAISHPKSV